MMRRKDERQLFPEAETHHLQTGKVGSSYYRHLLQAMKLRSICWLSFLQFTLTYAIAGESPAPARDGSHDFDFLIGDWKAHVRRLPDRLVGSNNWIDYNGVSNHKKHLHIKAQTLKLYNPDTCQWSIYLLDLDKGGFERTASRWRI